MTGPPRRVRCFRCAVCKEWVQRPAVGRGDVALCGKTLCVSRWGEQRARNRRMLQRISELADAELVELLLLDPSAGAYLRRLRGRLSKVRTRPSRAQVVELWGDDGGNQ